MRKQPTTPTTVRDRLFCERWLEHYDPLRAYREAGYAARSGGNATKRARAKLERFFVYLEPLRLAKAQQVGQQLAVRQRDVIEQMSAIAFLDPLDYLEQGSDGALRQKPLNALTPEQRAAVRVCYDKNGRPTGYDMPTIETKIKALRLLGQHQGLFINEIILQTHRQMREHTRMDFSHVPTAQLQTAIRHLLPVVGPHFARQLGFTAEEYEEAMQNTAVEIKGNAKPDRAH